MSETVPAADGTTSTGGDGPRSRSRRAVGRNAEPSGGRDRSPGQLVWYRIVQFLSATLALVVFRWRATGRHNLPETGAVLLVSNHLSFLDVFLLGIPARRPLNYVARSTLFVPVVACFMRSVGAFPIQREGMGASGMKETLRRLRSGGIVTLFPEGTRSADGELAPLKSGIAVLVARAGVPVVPVGLAGPFETWPRSGLIPVPHPIRIHYGRPIFPEELSGMETQAITAMIRDRLQDCCEEARRGLRRDHRF